MQFFAILIGEALKTNAILQGNATFDVYTTLDTYITNKVHKIGVFKIRKLEGEECKY